MLTICPNCGFEQHPSPRCLTCGMVFAQHQDQTLRLRDYAPTAAHPRHGPKRPLLLDPETVRNLELEFRQWLQPLTGRLAGLWENRFQYRRGPIAMWIRTVGSEIIQAVVYVVLSFLATTGALMVSRVAWSLYLETHAGRVYTSKFAADAGMIHNLLNLDPLAFTLELHVTVVITCLAIGIISRLFSLTHLLYLSRGIWVRVFIWGGICLAASAYQVKQNYWLTREMAWVVTALPVLILYNTCFKVATILVPELRVLIQRIYYLVRNLLANVLAFALKHLRGA